MEAKLTKINEKAAGIDIGAEKIFIAVQGEEVKNFDTFTASYLEAVRFLQQKCIETVAMEATGVYWIALYELLEKAGIKVSLVNGAHVKNVPGRKSDVKDCQWLQQLHSYGLLRSSFIPEENIRILRSFNRLRNDHIQMAASHINHIQKSLDLMNIKLQYVISQITGASGMRILKAILAGERNAKKLVLLCDGQILKKKKEQVVLSLEGNYKSEHIFALKQAVECYEFYQTQIFDCDKQIEAHLESLTRDKDLPEDPTKPKAIRHHKPQINELHNKLLMLTGGKDASQIAGLTDLSFMKLLSEVGLDMDKWKTSKHFTSWLGLAPNMHQSGKSKKKRRRKVKTNAGQIFREAAQSVGQSKYLALGGFYRRIRAKSGALVANVATARKIAVLFYNTLKYGVKYVEEGLIKYEQKFRQKMELSLMKRAKDLGFELKPTTPQIMEVH